MGDLVSDQTNPRSCGLHSDWNLAACPDAWEIDSLGHASTIRKAKLVKLVSVLFAEESAHPQRARDLCKDISCSLASSTETPLSKAVLPIVWISPSSTLST